MLLVALGYDKFFCKKEKMLDIMTAWRVMIFIHSFRRNISFFYRLQLKIMQEYPNRYP